MSPSIRARLIGLLAIAAAGPALAEDGWVTAPNSEVRLNWCGTAADPVGPAAHRLAFLEIRLAPGWKTYWRIPGDAGVAPSFEWTADSNVGKATVYFPAPHRMVDQGGEAIGYKTAVVFPIRIEPRDPKSDIPATVNASFGICKNICVPVDVTLHGACHSMSPEIAAAVEAVPRAPGQARASDPKLLAVSGSVAAATPKLTVDVDFGAGATATDLFIEAPEGLYVPLPAPASPDAHGHARFTVDLSKSIDAKDLAGKQLRLTMVSSKGASEALWLAK